MAKLINGNGNPAIYASQDADLIASLSGNTTSIAAVGNEFTATQEDANTIGLADGVIITQEGRRIQLDDGDTDLFTIPTGTAGTTSYYIIGYKLSTQADSSQTCETFVQKMNSSSETITEDTFKGGATDVYVSCYRVTQDGLNIDSINLLLPKLGNISELNADLTELERKVGMPVLLDIVNKEELTTTEITASNNGAIIGQLGNTVTTNVLVAPPSDITNFQSIYTCLGFDGSQDSCYIYGIEKGSKIKLDNLSYSGRHIYFIPYKDN